MLLKDALFNTADIKIFQVGELRWESDDEYENFPDWETTPITGPTLSADATRDEMLDGHFLISSLWIKEDGESEDCYIDITLPERISEMAYLMVNREIVRKWKHEIPGEFVSAVAIEGNGNYELYYSRRRPDIGIEVLYEGLKVARKRAAIALDLGYILRDEDRNDEAIAAFSIVINEGEPNEFTFLERAGLYEKIGDEENSRRDRQTAEKLMTPRLKDFLTTISTPNHE